MKHGDRRQRSPAKHDQGYKLLFSHPRIVESFLLGFLGKDRVAGLDLSTLERVPSSLISDDLQERHGDIFWRLRWKKSDPARSFLYLMVEFQSRPDPSMAVRFLAYVGLLLQALLRRKRGRAGTGLPAVLSIVLYNGKAPWHPPVDLGRLFEPVPLAFRRCLPRLRYLLFDENRLDLGRPELEGNLVAALFRIETCESPDQLPGLLRDSCSLLSREDDPELRRIVTIWLTRRLRNAPQRVKMILAADLEGTAMLEETIAKWERKIKREGVVEGRQEGMREMILDLMKLRFGPVPPGVPLKLATLKSTSALRSLGKRVMDASSLADLGRDWARLTTSASSPSTGGRGRRTPR
ncbi:MAG TPA: Rpn family recombination-promoting nuclease/putative transposase [Thermoanaerobaculia bacterium]|nr:Rpn family recombination-promoting nuclease/putative transposase [Thermoanaerobaculia bacterium]